MTTNAFIKSAHLHQNASSIAAELKDNLLLDIVHQLRVVVAPEVSSPATAATLDIACRLLLELIGQQKWEEINGESCSYRQSRQRAL